MAGKARLLPRVHRSRLGTRYSLTCFVRPGAVGIALTLALGKNCVALRCYLFCLRTQYGTRMQNITDASFTRLHQPSMGAHTHTRQTVAKPIQIQNMKPYDGPVTQNAA